MAEEYKALTYVNLPFLDGDGRLYTPGSMIPLDAFEESVSLAEESISDPNATLTTAEEMINDLIQWGSLSGDPEAELHPDHRPVVPGVPTVTGLVSQAQYLVAQLKEEGADVPPELQALAESQELISTGDTGSGGDVVA
jgi:hypothetical protein